MSHYVAVPLAVLASLVAAFALAALSMLTVDLFLKPSADDIGAAMLALLVSLNVAIATFVALVSILVNQHHKTTWMTPTAAFASCIVLVRLLGPFDVKFAPFMLGTGTVTWLGSCWFTGVRNTNRSEETRD
jgi:hypothetical protein